MSATSAAIADLCGEDDGRPVRPAVAEVLARAEPLLPGRVCLSDRMPPDLRRRYVEAAARMHDQTRYRQSMIVMRVSRIVPWEARFLDTTRALLARHAALAARGGK